MRLGSSRRAAGGSSRLLLDWAAQGRHWAPAASRGGDASLDLLENEHPTSASHGERLRRESARRNSVVWSKGRGGAADGPLDGEVQSGNSDEQFQREREVGGEGPYPRAVLRWRLVG